MRTARLCALSAIILCILGVSGENTACAAPRLQIAQPSFHAGQITEGAPIAHDFIFQNTGDQPLTFSAATGSDVLISITEPLVQPGAWGKIGVRLAGSSLRGDVSRQITVLTNDPLAASVTLLMQATIQEILSVAPATINFGRIRQDKNYLKKITITNNSRVPLVITQIIPSPAEHVLLSDLRYFTLLPRQPHELTLTFLPGKFSGVVEGSLLIRTTARNLREKIIPLRAEVISGGRPPRTRP